MFISMIRYVPATNDGAHFHPHMNVLSICDYPSGAARQSELFITLNNSPNYHQIDWTGLHHLSTPPSTDSTTRAKKRLPEHGAAGLMICGPRHFPLTQVTVIRHRISVGQSNHLLLSTPITRTSISNRWTTNQINPQADYEDDARPPRRQPKRPLPSLPPTQSCCCCSYS